MRPTPSPNLERGIYTYTTLALLGRMVFDLANADIPKLYDAYELRDENVQLHVFDSEETLEDAEKIRLKLKEFRKDENFQELKINQPII
ncbi:hypothetical protein Tco_0773535 [Tanacetum coccineum]|uniref:Uncharacterized protein n=1 Tax=Tanacetum coccineum TaxID=301880 RepID=A0ABQ4ZL55_9ASTR